MKLFCPKSAVSYTCDVGYGHGKIPHPIFQLPLKALIMQHLQAYTLGKLPDQDLHLLGCALVNHFPVEWRAPLRVSKCLSYWKQNIERLATIITKLDPKRFEELPSYVISSQTQDLGSFNVYLESVLSARELSGGQDWHAGQEDLELQILRTIRSSMQQAKSKKLLPELIADWAVEVGNFPDMKIQLANSTIPLSQYWRHMIVEVFRTDSPVSILSSDITRDDLDELIEHLEENLELGSIHSMTLMRKLREARSVIDEFRPRRLEDLEDPIAALLEDSKVSFMEVSVPSSSEPKTYLPGEPRRESFTTMAAYLQAKISWKKSQEGGV